MKYLLTLTLMLICSATRAQLPQAWLSEVFPAGAQRGTEVTVTLHGGGDLDEVSQLFISHPGITAEPLLDGAGAPIANQFRVTVADDVPCGFYDIRAKGLFGITNPRVFRVDRLPEHTETEPNHSPASSQSILHNRIVNARFAGEADVDVYTFEAQAGQTIVIRSEAARLDSLAQPVLQLFAANGRRLARANRADRQDAVIVYTSPHRQSLTVKCHDLVYRGGNGYSYRLCLDDRPVVDFAVPQIIAAGAEQIPVTFYGRHLPGGNLTDHVVNDVRLFRKETGLPPIASLQSGGLDAVSQSTSMVLYTNDDAVCLPLATVSALPPHVMEDQPLQAVSLPQSVSLPASISGSFGLHGDEDIYRFSGKAGERWQIDVLADRLRSPADPVFVVERVTTDENGREQFQRLGREEMSRQNPAGAQFPTYSRDPSYLLSISDDGTYQLRLTDLYRASRGAANLRYTLVIRQPQPDFRVVLFESRPSADGKAAPGVGAVTLRKGGTYAIPVYAYRLCGHNEDIRLEVRNLPSGVTSSGGVIPSGKSAGTLLLKAAPDAAETVANIRVTASSPSTAESPAGVATLIHRGGNGLPMTGRISQQLMVSVIKDEAAFTVTSDLTTVDIFQDRQVLLPVKVQRRAGFTEKIDVTFSGQPQNVDAPKVTIPKDADSGTLRLFFRENAPAESTTLQIYGTAQVPYRRNPWRVDRLKTKLAAADKTLAMASDEASAVQQRVKARQEELTALNAAMAEQKNARLQSITTLNELKTQLTSAIDQHAEASAKLAAFRDSSQQQLQPDTTDADLTAAIGRLQQSVKQVRQTITSVAAMAQQTQQLESDVNQAGRAVVTVQKQLADTAKKIATCQTKLNAAQTEMAEHTRVVAAAQAKQKSAADAVQAAEKAAAPQNKNVRVTSGVIHLKISKTPGKITADVANGGKIAKGGQLNVKVTLKRRNAFEGPVSVKLVLPPGESRVACDTVEIPDADTTANLTLTATEDSATGRVAHAVIRATCQFSGRMASFDAPCNLEVTE